MTVSFAGGVNFNPRQAEVMRGRGFARRLDILEKDVNRITPDVSVDVQHWFDDKRNLKVDEVSIRHDRMPADAPSLKLVRRTKSTRRQSTLLQKAADWTLSKSDREYLEVVFKAILLMQLGFRMNMPGKYQDRSGLNGTEQTEQRIVSEAEQGIAELERFLAEHADEG